VRQRTGIRWDQTENRYRAEIYLGRDENGRALRKRFAGPRHDKSDEALRGLKDLIEQYRTKRAPRKRGARVHSRTTLGEYLAGWLETKDLSDAAHANYTWAIDSYLTPNLGARRLYDLDRDTLRLFFSRLNLGHESKLKIRTVLHSALEDAVNEHKLIPVNPASRLKLKRTQQYAEIPSWTPEESARFLSVARGSEHYPMFLVMIAGVLGPAETFAIRWKYVDLQHGRLAIAANLTNDLTDSQKAVFHERFPNIDYSLTAFRDEVEAALIDYYGSAAVKSMNKCILVPGQSGRLNADVLPCRWYRRYDSKPNVVLPEPQDGIEFFTRNDHRSVINYPKQHYDNGVVKNKNTSYRFKPTVRIFKNFSTYLFENVLLARGSASSYFITCLIYNAPNATFERTYFDTVLGILQWMHNLSDDDIGRLVCQNHLVWLCRDLPGYWKPDDFIRFRRAAIGAWNDWGA
jgi:hypothetical protein